MAAAEIGAHRGDASLPRATKRFNALAALCGLWFVSGLVIDGWAHSNLDLSREGFFTPYHAVFYSGFAALVIVIFGQAYVNRRALGGSWRHAVPAGYDVTVAGLAIFAVGGLLDMLWHVAFGIEKGTEALLSPTHLLLATGGAIMLSGPLRTGLARAREGDSRNWSVALGWLIPLTFLATLVSYVGMWAFWPATAMQLAPSAIVPGAAGKQLQLITDFEFRAGAAAVVLRAVIVAGFALWIVRRVAVPAGALTVLIAIPTVLIGVMLSPDRLPIVLAAGLASGLSADVVVARFAPGVLALRAFAFVVPFAYWAAHLLASALVAGAFWWSPHFLFGSPVIAGMSGLLLCILSEAVPSPRSV